MTDVDEARKRWLQEQPAYARFGELVADRLRMAIQERGIWCQTSSRPKETHSLIKKLLKGKYTYDSLSDKVGARCIVRYRAELDVVLALAAELFDCSEPDRKATELGSDRIGYDSIHVQVRLRQSDPDRGSYLPNELFAELQIRTLGQHLWSEMTHDNFYKSDATIATLSADLQRRVHLMAGLIEVADREFDRLSQETALSPEAQMYQTLEQHYYKLTAKRPDPSLSLEVIRLLLPLYGGEDVPVVTQRLDTFFDTHRDTLEHVYQQAEEWTSSPFLFQPEVLMIYERLDADPLKTRKQWVREFPENELEGIALAFGISFD